MSESIKPAAWMTKESLDGKTKLQIGDSTTNPAYVAAHKEWRWVPLYTREQLDANPEWVEAANSILRQSQEIDRLRAALEISHPPLPVRMVQCGVYCATAKGLIDDADRLRAALRDMRELLREAQTPVCIAEKTHDTKNLPGRIAEALVRARAALGE